MNSTELLVISGAIVAALLVVVAPENTVNTVAERIGLKDQTVGPVVEKTDDDQVNVGPAMKATQPKRASRAPITGDVVAKAIIPANADTAVAQGTSKDQPGTESAKSRRMDAELHSRPAIKTTSTEHGHLIERFVYLNGVTVLLDGSVPMTR